MTALELINIICPEHSRTSCSDENINNGFYHSYELDEPISTISNEHMPRCTRCALLQLANGTSTDDNKVIETTSIYLK
jgi:hypothetical protein